MVFYISVAMAAVFVIGGVLFPSALAAYAGYLFAAIIDGFGWFYLWATLGFLVFCVYLAFSRFGKVRLGRDNDKPVFSNLTWFSMLFSAGMGIGLVFWGVAEPMFHYMNPPLGLEAKTPEAARAALRYAFFHWGLHPWGIYTVMALAIAYFSFRKEGKNLISETFTPLGSSPDGLIGKAIDVLAIIATVFGVATSLGLGALQINSGLTKLFGVPGNVTAQLSIIGIVTVVYILSASTGLNKGIAWLSNANIAAAALLLIFVVAAGPTAFLFEVFTVTFGGYIQEVAFMSLRLTPFSQASWVGEWTLFYWAWWIAWAPFVGSFIARVSRGRTIKEFVLGVLLVPSIFSFLWFSVFGGTALNLEMFQGYPIGAGVQQDIAAALFTTLEYLPFGRIASLLALVLIITFFITSADSATFVLGMFSTDGNPDPSNRVKFIWGILQSSIATVLLLSGGLKGLQQASIVASLPFAVIMVFMCVSLLKALKKEKV
ncbi:BCCT family transporter [Anaeroselena agilis]|uniref:BCCT family transporter n=1 Tax=Anaeroselena agilis TaxID=3063788 RepID=A0ABU3NZZ0_9FIRM|nr:BCCT family transporter [Selenomonadales bacterium 4137-cl]